MEQGTAPSFELPPEAVPSPENEQGREQANEAPPARLEQAAKQPKQPALPPIPDDLPSVNQPVIAAPPQDLAAAEHHPALPDSDRMPPAYLHEAKGIEASTADDPHQRVVGMSQLGEKYKKGRFNWQPKTDQEAA